MLKFSRYKPYACYHRKVYYEKKYFYIFDPRYPSVLFLLRHKQYAKLFKPYDEYC